MSDSITVQAPAKINIGLEVFPKRQDGYHNIRSIFTLVDLCDELTVSITGKRNDCVVECDSFDLPEDNTFTKAYKAFCVLTGVDDGVHVKVNKHIPAGGGLGGGSSDASSFIQSMDILFGAHLDQSSLNEISAQVGSDVFFFTRALYSGKSNFTAVCEGRGEKITEIQGRKDFSVLLVFPNVNVSTKEAYGWIDGIHQSGTSQNPMNGCSLQSFVEEFNKPVQKWVFRNDFTSPVSERIQKINAAILSLKECGADFVDMSGSGSSVFGIFDESKKAQKALKIMAEDWQAALV